MRLFDVYKVVVYEKTTNGGYSERVIYPNGIKPKKRVFNPNGMEIIRENLQFLEKLEELPKKQGKVLTTSLLKKFKNGPLLKDNPYDDPSRQPRDKGNKFRKPWQKHQKKFAA